MSLYDWLLDKTGSRNVWHLAVYLTISAAMIGVSAGIIWLVVQVTT